MEIKLFVAREIQYFEYGIFSFNSSVYYLTCAFTLQTWAFSNPTRAFNLATHAFSVLTREFEPVTRRFEIVTCRFNIVTRGFQVVPHGFWWCRKNDLIRKIRLISKFTTSQPGSQTITIHIFLNISRSKGNRTF